MMNDFFYQLPEWVTWVFSGIGVAVLGWLGMLFFSKKSRIIKQTQKAGDGSTQIMSGRDTKYK